MVYLVSPTATPPAPGPASRYVSAQHTWIGWDGAEWDLSYGLSGLKLMKGVRGMQDVPHQRYSSKSPGRAGSAYRGSVADERTVLWPLKIFNYEGSAEWVAHADRFWQTMDRDRPGLWVVTQPGTEDRPAVRRTLRVRYDGLVEDADDDDPGLVPWVNYGINLVADEDPFWRGETISRTFKAPAAENFYGGSSGGGYGPPYVISSGSTTDTATITNPGDAGPAWPTWTVHGPSTSVTVGIDGHNIEFPMVLADGQLRRINTDPGDQVAYDENDQDVTGQLGEVDFAEIPRGTDVPLSISITGTGSVDVEITPGYLRAKGPA